MYMNNPYNTFEYHTAPRGFCHGGPEGAPEGFSGPGGPNGGRGFGGPDCPGGFGDPVCPNGGRGFGGPGGPGGGHGRGFGGPGGPGGPGFPPHGGPGFPPPGGMPPFGGPRRPNPDFLLRRVEDADLPELIDMAGRLLHRLPQGGPARGQALILSILAGREALSQRELQQMLGIQPGSLSELISKLEAKGLLTREKAEDRRGNLLRITDAGRDAIPGIQAAPEDDPFAPLTPEQQDQLSDMLRALLTRWIGTLEPCPRGSDKPVEV